MSGSENTREFLFQVNCTLLPGEVVCISGDCRELGHWKWDNLLPMQRDQEEPLEGSQLWTITVTLPANVDISYRYVVCVVVENDDGEKSFVVRRTESNIKPRRIKRLVNPNDPFGANTASPTQIDTVDEFGTYGGQKRIELGWLTTETAIQLKIYNNPIQLWQKKYQNTSVRLKMVPVHLSGRSAGLEVLDDFHDSIERVGWPFIEIAVMNTDEHQFSIQQQFGRVYRPEDMILFQARISNFEDVAYMIDFYLDEPDEVPTLIGFCHILPYSLKGSNGFITLPIINVHQQPVGKISFEYMVIKPLSNSPCDFSVSYCTHWSESWTGLDVGHRGSGNSSKHLEARAHVRENSIASLICAAQHGVDFVEFDVQLSKDLVPVLFHDFFVNISLHQKTKRGGELTTIRTAVQELTVKQLQDLKVSHESEDPAASDDDLTLDHDPFPTLKHALEALPIHTGFNVEIKWPMLLKNGNWDGVENPLDLNLAMDIILHTLFENAGSRRIILSCFHPTICTMLRLKQNKYPVLFLTQGVTAKYPEYNDPRTRSIPMAIFHALSTQMLGVCLHTEDILRDPSQLKEVTSKGLVAFCWGDDNNEPSTVQYLKSLGFNGVIYDRIHDHMVAKKSIFEMELEIVKDCD